jgi:hypothetical protein
VKSEEEIRRRLDELMRIEGLKTAPEWLEVSVLRWVLKDEE